MNRTRADLEAATLKPFDRPALLAIDRALVRLEEYRTRCRKIAELHRFARDLEARHDDAAPTVRLILARVIASEPA
jgi:hypothetical protein